MANEVCATCKAPIENAAVTGIFCTKCYEKDVAPNPGWKAYLTGPLYIGFIAVGVPWVFTIRVNALNYVALAGGAIGTVCALAGFVYARKAPADEVKKKLTAAGIVLALGLL